MKCPKCAEEAGTGKFCRNCGSPVAANPAAVQPGAVCPFCGAEVRPGAKFCAQCAAPLGQASAAPIASIPMVAATTMCVNCGAQMPVDTKFCKSCGKPMAAGAAAVSPDLMPTAMMSSPVPPPSAPPARPAVPPPAQAQPVAGPRPVVAPSRMEPVPVPPPAKIQPPKAPFAGGSQSSGGGNKTLVIASVVVLALVAAGAVYKFVLHKRPAQTEAVAQAPVSTPPATPAPTETSPQTTDEPATTMPPTSDVTPTEAAPAGNSAPTGSGAPAPVRGAKKSPSRPLVTGPAYAQAHANAEAAMASSQYLSPADGSALFWARKAKAQGDPAAGQIEQAVFTRVMADVTTARQSHSYDQAQSQLSQLASNFPDHPELKQTQDDLKQEQQKYTQQQEEQRHQAELAAQTKKFAVQHKHGTGSSFCNGMITVTPDGIAKYDCTTADNGGRCEHVVFAAGSIKEVKLKGDGSIHMATFHQGNFDFSGGDFTIKDVAAALTPLVKH